MNSQALVALQISPDFPSVLFVVNTPEHGTCKQGIDYYAPDSTSLL